MLYPTKKKLNVSDDSGPRNLGNKIKKTEIEKKRNTFFEVKFFQIFEFLRVFFCFFKEISYKLLYIYIQDSNEEIFSITKPSLPHTFKIIFVVYIILIINITSCLDIYNTSNGFNNELRLF